MSRNERRSFQRMYQPEPDLLREISLCVPQLRLGLSLHITLRDTHVHTVQSLCGIVKVSASFSCCGVALLCKCNRSHSLALRSQLECSTGCWIEPAAPLISIQPFYSQTYRLPGDLVWWLVIFTDFSSSMWHLFLMKFLALRLNLDLFIFHILTTLNLILWFYL